MSEALQKKKGYQFEHQISCVCSVFSCILFLFMFYKTSQNFIGFGVVASLRILSRLEDIRGAHHSSSVLAQGLKSHNSLRAGIVVMS